MDETFLKDPFPPDIAELSAAEAVALSAAARRDGFAVFELDGAAMKTKPDLMEHCALALCFPGDFGKNWDAMVDYLGDMATFHKNNHILVLIRSSAEIAGADPALYGALRDVCGLACDNARQWSKSAVTLKFVFVR